jgi:6-pyruvoyltetrahydropterin/6-carboxytetrahydropterin synthase
VIKAAFEPIKELLDHRYINDVAGLENPTAEKPGHMGLEQIEKELPLLHEVWVFETPLSGTVYRGK